MFHRILVPLDGSPRAEEAFLVAQRIAHASGSTVTLLRVVEPSVLLDGYTSGQISQVENSVETEMKDAKAYLMRVLDASELEGIGVTTAVRIGVPAQQILLYAKEQQIDLLIMCSHGITGLQRWLLGSVAQKLARHSPVPILIVREGHPLLSGSQDGTKKALRALVPLDGSPLAEEVLLPVAQLVTALAAPATGALHLVRVAELVPTADVTGTIAALSEQDVEQAKTYLRDMEQRLQKEPFASFHLSVSSSVAQSGDVASLILGAAERGGQQEGQKSLPANELIAMATHGRTGLARWIMGSITERVLSATTLPMLIVRPEKVPSQLDLQAAAQDQAHLA